MIKSQVVGKNTQAIQYPVLARSGHREGERVTVLFTGQSTGMVVAREENAAHSNQIGRYTSDWAHIDGGNWEFLQPHVKVELQNQYES